MATRYQGKHSLKVAVGATSVVELPPQVFRGRLVGMLFDTDKTFLLPGAMRGIRELKHYYDDHPGMDVLVVGHTDSVGSASYNVELSRERARSIAAFLRDQVDDWLASYRGGKPAGKAWGAVEDQLMLQQLAGYDGNIDGKLGAKSQEAVRRFQGGTGLAVTGRLDEATRRELVARYMGQDGTTLSESTPLTIHGAGPYHPEDRANTDEARRRNRRVEIFLSDGPIEPPPGAPEGSEYDAWVKAATETVDFHDAPEEVVELDLMWPAALIERMPDDLLLELSGAELAKQSKTKSAGIADADWVRFEFRWLERDKRSNLDASGGGKQVALWKDQLCGALGTTLVWSGDLDALLPDTEDEDATDIAATGGGSIPDDLGPEDQGPFPPEVA